MPFGLICESGFFSLCFLIPAAESPKSPFFFVKLYHKCSIMRKGIKIFLSFISSIILIVIVLPVLAAILLSNGSIQNYVAGKVTDHLSKKLGTTVTLDHIGIKLFNRVTLDGFYVEDLRGDTLLYSSRLDVGFRGYNPKTGAIRLGEVRAEGADFRIAQDSTGITNLKHLTEKLRNNSEQKEEKKPFVLHASGLRVDRSRFRLQRYDIPERRGAINFADMDISGIALDIDRFSLVNDSIEGRIRHISAREKSGFVLNDFSGEDVRVWSRGIRIKNFYVKDLDSEVRMEELHFDYPQWSSFNRYVDEVRMHAIPRKSRVAFRTIGWFAPRLKGWQSVVLLDGTIDGTVADLSGRFNDAVINDTRLDTHFSITGLPDIEKTRFVLDVNELLTNATGASEVLNDITGKDMGKTARSLARLETVRIFGRFEGLLTDFQINGKLQSAPGEADFNVRLNPGEKGRTYLDGEVSLEHFALGDLLAVSELENTTLSARLNGFMSADTLQLEADAVVGLLRYNGYDYKNIRVDGEIRNNYYTGFVGSDDPNADFGLEGTFDFNGEIPRYDFSLALNRLDLHELNLNRRDSVSVLSADIQINAQGSTLDDVTGHGAVSGLVYAFPGDTLRSTGITLLGDNLSEQKRIWINSDFLEAELTSRMSITDILPYAKNALRYYLPSLDTVSAPLPPDLRTQLDSVRLTSAENYYAFRAQIKENGHFISALLPGLYINEGTNMSLLFNPATRNFSMMLHSDLIEYNNIYVSKLTFTNRNEADSIALYVRSDEVGIGNFFMPDLTVHGGIRDNLVNVSGGFNNPLNGMSAMINTVSQLRADTAALTTAWHTRVMASRLRVGDQEWRITSPAIVWGQEVVDVNKFRIMTPGQDFLLDGRMSADPTDTLHLSMTNFDLSPLSGLIDRFGYSVKGRMNGHADLIAGKGDALFYGRIRFEGIRFNDKPIQNSTFVSEWDPVEDRIRTSLVLASQDTVLRGGYRPGDKRYYLNGRIPNIDLSLLSPVLKGVLTDIEGTADADVVLRGTGGTPSLNGTIRIPSFAATVDFTRARYRFSDATVRVVDNSLLLPETTIYDDEGGEGKLELALRTRYFSQISYDVKVTPQRLLALNTTLQDNDYFYGKAYASGVVAIKGDRRGVDMDMNVTTENNSTFFLPLTGASSIAEADFIVIEDPDQQVDPGSLPRHRLMRMLRERQRNNPARSDMEINMQINVRPNTEVQLVIDPKIGDIIRANGTGSLNLRLRPREDVFTMFGDYRINEGSYLFTLMNVFNKRFTIEQGSSIQWVGDPLNAILDVSAAYRVRANVAPITDRNQVIPVDCKILLSDRLSQPTIQFDITVPTADAELRSALQNAMNTQELKSQQFVWLLMSNSFYADNGLGNMNNIGTTATAVTGIEFLTNQFSNWLSNERFFLHFGYTPKSDLVSDEVEGMFSRELIPNRLLLEGEVNYNFGNNQADPRSENQLSGDFYLTYVIDRAGNLRAKVFTRTIDRYDENQGLQESGLGLYYKKDFNHWSELFRRRQRRKAQEEAESPDDPAQGTTKNEEPDSEPFPEEEPVNGKP